MKEASWPLLVQGKERPLRKIARIIQEMRQKSFLDLPSDFQPEKSPGKAAGPRVETFLKRLSLLLFVLPLCCHPSNPLGEGFVLNRTEKEFQEAGSGEKNALFRKIRDCIGRQQGEKAYVLLAKLGSFRLSEGERAEVKNLMKEARALLSIDNFCPGRCLWEKEWFREEDEVSFSVILENRTSLPISFCQGASRRPSQLQIFFEYREFDPSGPVLEMEWNQLIPVADEFSLGPGEEWAQRVSLPPERRRAHLPVYKRITVRGEMVLASVIEIPLEEGERLAFNRLVFSPGETEIFPRGIEAIVPDPEGHILRALSLVEREPRVLNNIFVAAIFLSKEDLHRCVDLLLEQWEGREESLGRTFVAALSLITGKKGLHSRAEWRQWWKANAPTLPVQRQLPGQNSGRTKRLSES